MKTCLSGLTLFLLSSLLTAEPAHAGTCSQRMGPFGSQYAANAAIQQAQAYGFQTSGVWGEGGIALDYNFASRRYFFNVFYPC